MLIDACASAMADQNKKKKFNDDTQGKMIKRQYDEFVKLYNGKLKELGIGHTLKVAKMMRYHGCGYVGESLSIYITVLLQHTLRQLC